MSGTQSPDDALEQTQREMDQLCPYYDDDGRGRIECLTPIDGKPCPWIGHALLKRRDAAVRLDALDDLFQRRPTFSGFVWDCIDKIRNEARRAYEEASNGK